ncbi:hypothetical protein [Thiohalophilus thiocyanatoxydans]|uniref:Uncharacterized protein n=1 Tax=Thiohalophilus thiocyanatoxydans TaxID=381308 RepID=A0A4R8IQR3_9GAMM|nr:hypothetical protein [Thiohalophilus thiocyanatoxydans]TDY01600.1 hypothetical protein EDC23_1489 [Thiohalophilus thiocyanatoxydans]
MHLQLESRLGDVTPSLQVRAVASGQVLVELEPRRLRALLDRGDVSPTVVESHSVSDHRIMALVDRLGCWREFVRGCLNDPAAVS